MTEYKNIKVYPAYKEALIEMSKSQKKTILDFTHQMIDYFKDSEIDPSTRVKSTADELAKLRNTVISFLRTMEDKKLKPLVASVNDATSLIVDHFNNEAATKEDIRNLANVVMRSSHNKEQEVVQLKQEVVEKVDNGSDEYKYKVERAKKLFNELLGNLKDSKFGSTMTIEKKVISNYRELFESL